LEKQVFLEGVHNKNNAKIGHHSLICKKSKPLTYGMIPLFGCDELHPMLAAKKLLALETFVSQ
jgi:hypothetical protein